MAPERAVWHFSVAGHREGQCPRPVSRADTFRRKGFEWEAVPHSDTASGVAAGATHGPGARLLTKGLTQPAEVASQNAHVGTCSEVQ